MVLVTMDLRWDTLAGAVGFSVHEPYCYAKKLPSKIKVNEAVSKYSAR